MYLPGGLGVAVLAGAGGSISQLLFGHAYRGDQALVAVLAFAELGVFAGTVIAAVLIGVDRRRALLAGTTAALAIDIVLCVLLLAPFGAIAAAWASLVSYAAAAIIAALLAPDARSIARPLVGITVKVAFAASLGAAAATWPGSVPASIATATVVYLIAVGLLFRRDLVRARRGLIQRRASTTS
jgi:O-antigen/teichoic acid export membrane protein